MQTHEHSHDFFMDAALEQAECALAGQEVPIGAVIVSPEGKIIGKGYNRVEKDECQINHAEILAIQEASKALGSWRLEGCWLYVTLEPCLMCLGAICLSRLDGVAFGAPSPEFGAFQMLSAERSPVYFKRLMVLRGLKENECVDMLKLFFKKARGKEYCESTSSLSRKD